MRSYITHSGYGYRKRLCDNVTTWFVNKFFPRHQLDIEIIHRGLNRENVYGYCSVVDYTHRPRQFLIELNTYMNEELYIKTLLHELVHIKQWVDGKLRFRYGKMCYCKNPVENYDYWNQPHEIEARQQESILYLQYVTQN